VRQQADPVCLVAFENELRLAPLLAGFEHAPAPRAYPHGSATYLLMDSVPGTDLWTHLKTHGCLSERDAVALVGKIARAVAALHDRRIVHLDLKLSNVMLTPEGDVRLIDFGLANHLDSPDLIYESFREPKGTPAYIAPEQFIGVRNEPRSDLYSIGVMLFELTTGKLPFAEQSCALDVIRRVKSKPFSPRRYNASLSPLFESIVENCLATNPDDRYATVREFAELLEDWESVCPPPGEVPADTRRDWLTRLAELPSSLSRGLGSLLNNHDDPFGNIHRWADRHRREHDKHGYRILAGLKTGPGREATNREIIRQALALARQHASATVTLATVVQVDIGAASAEKAEQTLNAALTQAREALATLATGMDAAGVNLVINVMHGDPVDQIAQCVTNYDIDLVVIGCQPRQALARFVHGHIGYKLLTTIMRSVYVVHPTATASAA
jgi:protein-serine/threonine kinase